MCDPGTAILAASAALEIGGTIGGAISQNKAAGKNKASATSALQDQRKGYDIRAVQEQAAAGQDKAQAGRQAAEAAGLARTSAAAAGVAGMSTDQLLGSIQADETRYDQSVDSNLTVTLDQIDQLKKGSTAQAQDRINSVPSANPFATGLRIAQSGLNLYGGLYMRNHPAGSDVKEKKDTFGNDSYTPFLGVT